MFSKPVAHEENEHGLEVESFLIWDYALLAAVAIHIGKYRIRHISYPATVDTNTIFFDAELRKLAKSLS